MKKILILSLTLIMTVSITGCGKKPVIQNEAVKKGGFEVTENNTLMGWLKRGKTVECTVETPMGKISMLAQNNKVRMEGVPYYSADSMGEAPKAENGVSLTLGDMIYFWDKSTKKGTKMNLKEMEKLSGEEEPEETKTWEDMVSEWEGEEVAYNCKEKELPSDYFKEPADVEFTDLNEMMKNLQNMGDNLNAQFNSGENVDIDALKAMGEKLKGPDGKEINMNDIEMPELE